MSKTSTWVNPMTTINKNVLTHPSSKRRTLISLFPLLKKTEEEAKHNKIKVLHKVMNTHNLFMCISFSTIMQFNAL